MVSALIPNEPGSLARLTRLVAESGIDIDYIYLGGGDSLLLKAEEYELLESLLSEHGVRILRSDDPV